MTNVLTGHASFGYSLNPKREQPFADGYAVQGGVRGAYSRHYRAVRCAAPNALPNNHPRVPPPATKGIPARPTVPLNSSF